MVRKDYKQKPLQPMQQSEQSIKRWHIAALALFVFILAVDWDATLTVWGL